MWTVAHQAPLPLSMGFPRQEYWNGLPFPSPGDLPNPEIKLLSPPLQAFSLPLSHLGSPWLTEWASDCQLLSHVQLFATLWTVARQAPLSMEFFTQEYWSGLPFFSPGDLPNSGIKSGSPALQADSLPFEPAGKPWLTIPHFKLGWP